MKNLRSVQRRMYLSLSIAILVISILNHGVQVISAPLQGHLLLYLDILCTQPSAINPTISLALNTCLNTLGVSGIVVQNQPSCTSGNATLIMYEDIACKRIFWDYLLPFRTFIMTTTFLSSKSHAHRHLYDPKSRP